MTSIIQVINQGRVIMSPIPHVSYRGQELFSLFYLLNHIFCKRKSFLNDTFYIEHFVNFNVLERSIDNTSIYWKSKEEEQRTSIGFFEFQF